MMIRRVSQFLRAPGITQYVKLSEPGNAGVIAIDRLDAKNVIRCEMVNDIYEALKDFEARRKVVIIKSSSDEVFSGGGDIKDLVSSPVQAVKDTSQTGYRSYHLIATYKVPCVSLISGLVAGGACVFSMSAKYRIATEKTIFAMPDAQIGFFNGSGSSYFLSRLDNNLGIYMGLTGARINGYDVKKSGLATHFVESKNLRYLEQNLTDCETHEDIENVLCNLSFTPENPETVLDENLSRIKRCFAGLTVEQIIDNLKSDGSEWSKETLKTLRRMSPTSVKVCHRHLNLGRHMSLEDCARMEWRLVAHFAIESDVKEGFRALLGDKDFQPNWNPATIEDVSDGHLIRFFSPLPDGDELTFEIKRCTRGFYVE